MRKIETTVDIDAPPAAVWDVLATFRSYPEWNPFVREISGEPDLGRRLHVRLQTPSGRGFSFKPRVTAAEPAQRFAWLGRLGLPGLFDGHHMFELTCSDNGTHLVHREEFRGLLVPFLWRSLDTDTRAGFEQMNQALKSRVEARAT